MAQNKVYRLPNGRLVLDLQSDLVTTPTRLVAPLIPLAESGPPLPNLEPIFLFDATEYLMDTSLMAAVPDTTLARPVGDFSEHDYTIRRAVDFLFTGV